MRSFITLGLLVGALSHVAAETTCNTAPAKKGKAYSGPNGIEDPTGDLWCASHQSACALTCQGSVLLNDCARTKDDAAQTSAFCWACTCADGTVQALGKLRDGRYGGTISTLTCAREYSNCLWEASNGPSRDFTQYMSRTCRQYSDCENDAMNYLNRYIDYTWTTVGAALQPATASPQVPIEDQKPPVSTTPIPALSMQPTTVYTILDSSTTTAVSTTISPESLVSSSSSSHSFPDALSVSITGNSTSSIILPTQTTTNTRQVSTTIRSSASATQSPFTSNGKMMVAHLTGVVGVFALVTAYT